MQEFLYSIISTFNDKLFVVDEDGIFVDFIATIESSNDLLTPVENFLGKHFTETLPPEISSQLDSKLTEAKIYGATVYLDYSIFVNGSTRWYRAIISEIKPTDKRQFLISVRDVTDYKSKELFLQNILDNSLFGVMSFTAVRNNAGNIIDLKWTSVNKWAAEFMSSKETDLVGTSMLNTISQSDGEFLFQKYLGVIESEETAEFEYLCEDKSSEKKIWLKIIAAKFEDGLIVTFEDITRKKTLELEADYRTKIQVILRKLATNFINFGTKDIDEVINESIAEIGEFVKVDRVYIFDYLFEKNIMRNTHEWCSEGTRPEIQNLQFVPCDMIPEWVNQHRNNEIVYIKNVYDIEEGVYLRDLLISQDIKSLTSIPLTAGKDCIGFVGFDSVKDFRCWNEDEIALLKLFADLLVSVKLKNKYEQILKENEQKFKNLAENMLDMVAVHNLDGSFVYVSPSCKTLLGFKPEDLIGKNLFEFIHPEDIDDIRNNSHELALKGERVSNVEYRFRNKHGEYIWFESNTNPIKNEDNEIAFLQTISRDVTKRRFSDIEIRKLNEELVELNVQKNKLFSIIAHDLRSPIASSQSILNLIDEDLKDIPIEELEEYISELKQSTSSSMELLEDLLLWASSQLNKVVFKPVEIELSEIIKEVISSLASSTSVKNISISNAVKPGVKVNSDRSMLKTVLRNLISNAVKYSYTNGVVTISSSTKRKEVVISISDHGVGIKDDDKSKIFNKTINFTTYGTGNEKGSGIGLDLCADFIKRMDGKVWFESEYGKGSTFFFTLKNL